MASAAVDKSTVNDDEALQPEASNEPEQKQLSDEDMARVREYLSSPIHTVERKPFRPLLMMIMLIVVMSTFSIISILIARLNGIY